MKLNLTLWREAVRRLEAELKTLKAERRRSRPQGEPFDDAPRLLCQAEATRLYCLRRWARGKLHAQGNLRWVRQLHGRAYSTIAPVTDLASQEALLRSVPGWLESFLAPAVQVANAGGD